MNRFISLIIIILSFLLFLVQGQQVKNEIYQDIEKSGGFAYAYHYNNSTQTPPPRGYKPFYINHYGRHGSRWLTKDAQYANVLHLFANADSANALTRLGKETYQILSIICKDALEKYISDLSALGAEQQRQIAVRMFHSFPQVFSRNKSVNASSSTFTRTVLSMTYFCDELKRHNPKLAISFAANLLTNKYVNFMHEQAKIDARHYELMRSITTDENVIKEKFAEEHIRSQRLVASLFSDTIFSNRSVKGTDLMKGLYYIASSLQNTHPDMSLYGIFEKDELYNLWLYNNYEAFLGGGSHPHNQRYPERHAIVFFKRIIHLADSAFEYGHCAADLHFGHDSNLVPLVTFLNLDSCSITETEMAKVGKKWQNFKMAPMAGNIQIVFFKKKSSNDVLVKILHNENEAHIPVATGILPYYHWQDVKQYLIDKINTLQNLHSND